MATLPRSSEDDIAGGQVGLPVPWFVGRVERQVRGQLKTVYDFRCVKPNAMEEALFGETCWLCGKVLDLRKKNALLIGPMCLITGITSEPRCHIYCAEYAAKVCPFMVRPMQKRHSKDMPAHAIAPRGGHSPLNPGAIALVHVDKSPSYLDDGLLGINGIVQVDWWQHGRHVAAKEAIEPFVEGALRVFAKCGRDRKSFEEFTKNLMRANLHGFGDGETALEVFTACLARVEAYVKVAVQLREPYATTIRGVQ